MLTELLQDRNYTYLEVVVGLQLTTHALQLVIINLVDLPQSLSHLVLPELTVLSRRVTVRQRRQLLELLHAQTYASSVV